MILKKKLMSCLLFINKHNESENLGTDFYDSNLKRVKTLPYKDNYGYSLQVDLIHGTVWRRKIKKERRCLQVNYVSF